MDENNNFLFSQEEMDSMESPNLFNQKREGPITVLGHTFPNDEERLAFFRDELRKRLPELRSIEGFPIADDEDIVALSDPPYYTACPNPWINDFISEWELEKQSLVSKGLRDGEKIVVEPYASDVSEGKGNPIYMAHTYHTKVPHPAIMRYILHYTNPGDIVLDGFCGTGMTGVAANACENPSAEERNTIENEWKHLFGDKPKWGKRHAICTDLSPYATMICYNYNTPVDLIEFNKEINSILKELEDEYGWMYRSKTPSGRDAEVNFTVWSDVFVCPNCGKEIVYWNAALNHEKKCLEDDFACPHCGYLNTKGNSKRLMTSIYDSKTEETYSIAKDIPAYVVSTDLHSNKRTEYAATEYDSNLIEKIDELENPFFFPTYRIPKGVKTEDPISSHNITHTHLFYTKRNLLFLSAFLDKIEKRKLNNKLKFIFTGMINRSTVMNRFSPRNFFYGGGGWCLTGLSGTLYVPALPMEVSVLEQIRGRISSMSRIHSYLPLEYDNLVSVSSATKLCINNDSVDYIFVDPPFGANLMYSELNFLAESWLKVRTNNKEEAIVNSSQQKTIFEYQQLMNESFKEFYRVLKPGKWLTIEFSNTSASVWNSIQNALQGVGFIVANVAALDKKQGSFNAVTSTTAVKQDLVITCFKPSDSFTIKFSSSLGDSNSVWEFVEEYLQHLPVHLEKGEKTTTVIERSPKILYDRLISFYVQKGLPVPMDASDFQNGLRERFEECDGMFFTAAQLNEYIEKKRHAPEFVPMGLIIGGEADGIEWLRNRLRDKPQTYQQIQPDWLQAIGGLRRGDILPGLNEILDENFIQEADGTWRLPNIQDDVDKDKLRTKALLKEFKTYVEAASKPKAKIKEVRVEAIRAGFKQCYIDKDFATIVKVGDKIPQNLLTEDEILLQFYDIALSHV